MGYLKIPNLYKDKAIMLFKECYAMEKIHGTSAAIIFEDDEVRFRSGGEKYERFIKLFNAVDLRCRFKNFGHESIKVFGEAYGGKQQGMSKTYGVDLKFIAFDVMIGDTWINVRKAHNVCEKLCLEFVDYRVVPTDIDVFEMIIKSDSEQAIRNGVGEGHVREGVVLRPLEEFIMNNGNRVISKHKNTEFQERRGQPSLKKEDLVLREKANDIADEWVVPMRLAHVLQKTGEVDDYRTIINAMVEDVYVEAKGEIIESKAVEKAIGRNTAILYKKHLTDKLQGGSIEKH